MEMSETYTEIFKALIKYRSKAVNPKKDRNNPHFQSKYASLDSIITTCGQILAECGMDFQQEIVNDKEGHIGVYTMLFHESGEWIKYNPVYLKTETFSQKVGSALTYAKRYSLGMALGVATDDDDDANSVDTPNKGKNQQSKPKQNSKPVKPKQGRDNQEEKSQPSAGKRNNGNSAASFQRRRFFAICGKKKIVESSQKALAFYFTGKTSRANLTDEEFKDIADFLEKSTPEKIKQEVDKALKAYKEGADTHATL